MTCLTKGLGFKLCGEHSSTSQSPYSSTTFSYRVKSNKESISQGPYVYAKKANTNLQIQIFTSASHNA